VHEDPGVFDRVPDIAARDVDLGAVELGRVVEEDAALDDM